MAIPFLQAARESYRVTVYATPPVTRMLGEFLNGIEFIAAAERWPARFRQAGKELRSLAPEVTVCAWSDARADVVARNTGAKTRIGFPMNPTNYYASQRSWRKRRMLIGQLIEKAAQLAGRKLLTTQLQRTSPSDSHFSNWQLVAKALGLKLPTQTPWFTPPAGTFSDKLTKFLKEQAGEPLWIVHSGGRLPTKQWPLDRFQAVLRDIFAAKEIPTLIVSGPGEEFLTPIGSKQRRLDCRSHTELAGALAQASAVLCNDSYPAHLAAALGKRVLTIFGSGEPAWFSPFENKDGVIQTDICPHHPCVDRCVMPSVVCLEAVGVEQVASKVRAAVRELTIS